MTSLDLEKGAGNDAQSSRVPGAMTRRTRTWLVLGALLLTLPVLMLVIALETGALVRFMATPSDWEPEPIAGLQVHCETETEPMPWTYCVHQVPGSASRDLLLHLHGRRGTARWWNDATYYPGELYAHWKTSDVPAPTVVSLSFGPLWLLVDDQASAFDVAFARVLTKASAWVGHDFDRNIVVGESMGGYNALLLGLDGGDRFDKVAALCPPLSAQSPFGTGVFERMSESSPKEAFMLIAMSHAFFEDEEHWREQDPVARVLDGAPMQPRLHMSCGTHDPWGCASGGQALVDTLTARGQTVDWLRLPEGHCAIDTERLAAFLASP